MGSHYMTTIGKHHLRDMIIVTRYDNDAKNTVLSLRALRQKPSQKQKIKNYSLNGKKQNFRKKIQMRKLTMTFLIK